MAGGCSHVVSQVLGRHTWPAAVRLARFLARRAQSRELLLQPGQDGAEVAVVKEERDDGESDDGAAGRAGADACIQQPVADRAAHC